MANEPLSRRNWLGRFSTASVGAGLLAAATPNVGAQPTSSSANDLGARVYNIRDFGAKGDGTTLDTAAIQGAIDACNNDQGGKVLVPAGNFLIGPIELKSNVTLHIVAGGKLLGTTDPKQYHPANGIPLEGDHTMGDGNVGLVYAANADNVTLEGMGMIDGQGPAVRGAGVGGRNRPYIALFYKCTNLVVRDLYLYHSAYHTLRICNSSYVRVDGIRIYSRTDLSPVSNNDGLHFISAQHVTVSNCTVFCQDDACALFGSCQFVTITNSFFSTRWSCFRFGGGIAENIAVSNCIIYQLFGCPIKLRCEPGSRYENMSFSNLIFKDVTGPISIGAGTQRPVAADSKPSEIAIVRNISFNNISGNVITKPEHLDGSTYSGATNPGEQHSCIIVNCVQPNIIENISFDGIRLTFGGGGTAADAARRDIPLIANEYFSLGPLPAYAFYARNARGLTINNVRFETATPDLRPAMVLDHVTDVSVTGLNAQANKDAASLLRFTEVKDVFMSATRVLTPASVFLQLEGQGCHAITVDGGDISKAATPLALKNGAAKSAVKMRV
jgi:polygalacturonase